MTKSNSPCILLPMAAPLIMSFFLGMTIKEAEIVPYQDLLENVILYAATLMLGLLLGTLCEASTLLNPKVAPLIILGVVALAVSGAVECDYCIMHHIPVS